MRLIQSVTLVGAVLAVVTAHADTIYVCWDGSGDYVTIQEGIDAAADGGETWLKSVGEAVFGADEDDAVVGRRSHRGHRGRRLGIGD